MNQIKNPNEQFYKEKAELEFLETERKQADYLNDFQEFAKPPTIPEEANNHDFYRPNPAVYQRRLNENPYEVDVGFTAVEQFCRQRSKLCFCPKEDFEAICQCTSSI